MTEDSYAASFARCYDRLTSDVDYRGQVDFILRFWRRTGLRPHRVADLGCGTGSLLGLLAGRGMELIGVDASQSMLTMAQKKLGGAGRLTLTCQRLERLDLGGPVDAAVCFLDVLNHLTSPAKLLKALKRVSLFLSPGGVFLFDLIGPWQYSHTLRDNVFLCDADDICCVWHSRFHPQSSLCRYDLTLFEREGGVFRRADEQFCERAYSKAQVVGMLSAAGLKSVGVFDGYGFRPVRVRSRRLVFAARKD